MGGLFKVQEPSYCLLRAIGKKYTPALFQILFQYLIDKWCEPMEMTISLMQEARHTFWTRLSQPCSRSWRDDFCVVHQLDPISWLPSGINGKTSGRVGALPGTLSVGGSRIPAPKQHLQWRAPLRSCSSPWLVVAAPCSFRPSEAKSSL